MGDVTHADAIPGAAFIEWLGRGLIDGTHWLALISRGRNGLWLRRPFP